MAFARELAKGIVMLRPIPRYISFCGAAYRLVSAGSNLQKDVTWWYIGNVKDARATGNHPAESVYANAFGPTDDATVASVKSDIEQAYVVLEDAAGRLGIRQNGTVVFLIDFGSANSDAVGMYIYDSCPAGAAVFMLDPSAHAGFITIVETLLHELAHAYQDDVGLLLESADADYMDDMEDMAEDFARTYLLDKNGAVARLKSDAVKAGGEN